MEIKKHGDDLVFQTAMTAVKGSAVQAALENMYLFPVQQTE